MKVKKIYPTVILMISGLMLITLSWCQTKTVSVTIDYSSVDAISSYHAGVTHTERSIDSWGNAVIYLIISYEK